MNESFDEYVLGMLKRSTELLEHYNSMLIETVRVSSEEIGRIRGIIEATQEERKEYLVLLGLEESEGENSNETDFTE